jgi:hypothetical protein
MEAMSAATVTSYRHPWTTARTIRLLVAILTCLACSSALAAEAAEITRRPPDAVAGRDAPSGAEFSARAEGDVVTVEVALHGGKRLLARIDHAAGSVSLRSLAAGPGGAETPASVDEADMRALQALSRGLGELPRGSARDALEGLLALLAEAPPGVVLDVDTAAPAPGERGRVAAAQAGIRSLCDTARATGSYTLGGQRVSTRGAVGPCYNEANECLGRCGRGCRSTTVAGYSNPSTVQRFTQDCLNHDLCVKRTGGNFGPCTDELLAAADDFLLAPDCASLSGRWTDNLDEVWRLEQRADLSVRGTVTLPRCGRFAVRGRHEGPRIALTATKATSTASCPSRLSYAGRLNSCDVARGAVTAQGAQESRWVLRRGD